MRAPRLALVATLSMLALAACGGGAAKPGADGPCFDVACEAGASCDRALVLCKSVAPTCPDGQVASVEGSCWGACVPVTSCACTNTAQCPTATACAISTNRCG